MLAAVAYVLGLFTAFLFIVIFWFISTKNDQVADTYKSVFCSGLQV